MMPYCIDVFGRWETTKVVKVKGKRGQYETRTETKGYGFQLWNPCEDAARMSGRPGFGSFQWYGIYNARRAALDALMQPGIDQVAISTNQSKRLFTFYRHNLDQYIGQLRFTF
jgi:hypothetical protein